MTDPALLFGIFRDIGILDQLSRARLEARLPPPLIAPHFAVISHLTNGRDGASPIEMARAFEVPKTSMTHTLKGLEKHGYVTLAANPADGRSKMVWLTDKGRGLLPKTVAALAPEFARAFHGFDVKKLEAIAPLLTELRITLDAARAPKA